MLSRLDREDATIRTRTGTTAAAGLLLAAGWFAGCASRPAPPRRSPPETASAPPAPPAPAEAGVETARRAEEELERAEPPAADPRGPASAAAPAEPGGDGPPAPRAAPRHEALSGHELLYVVEIPFAGDSTKPGPAARARLGQLAERLALGDAAFALELQVAAGRLAAERARAVADDLARRGWRGFHVVTLVAGPHAPPPGSVRVLVLR